MGLGTSDVVSGIASGVALIVLVRKWRGRHVLPLPPGPPKRFLIGNIPDMPTENEWLKYNEWKDEYGASFISIVPTTLLNVCCR
jgi:hypothetical protein